MSSSRDFARQLRTQLTDAEKLLWRELRAHRFQGLKFKRQEPLGNYVVDFICFEHRLIVELDGSQHMEAADYDQQRDTWLQAQGFQVLRFWNNDALSKLESVLETILAHCQHAPSPQPLPPHEGGGAKANLRDLALLPLRGGGGKGEGES